MCPFLSTPSAVKLEENDFHTIHCRGRFDEDTARIVPCTFQAPRLDTQRVQRLFPFYLEEPTEEEKEAMKKQREEGRGEGVNKYADNPVAQDLLKQAESLDLDLASNEGKKKAAADFVGLVEGKVDLPENRNAKMEIGKLVMANQDKSGKEIMEAIFSKYGFAKEKEEKAAAAEAAAEAACKNPKNAPLILAFKECAKVIFLFVCHDLWSTSFSISSVSDNRFVAAFFSTISKRAIVTPAAPISRLWQRLPISTKRLQKQTP